MTPRELEALAKRLGDNPADTDALNAAYAHGLTDPRGYAVFLEKAGQGSFDPASGAHWYCEAATVWTASLSDSHRAVRALMNAVEKDPSGQVAADRLSEVYRTSGDLKALAGLHDRRAKGMEKLLPERPELAGLIAGAYGELGRLLHEELAQPDKAVFAYKKAIEFNPADALSIYQAREILKASAKPQDAIPLFAAEQALLEADPDRRRALYLDEAEVCRNAGDEDGALRALRGARSVDRTDDPGLKQQLASTILERLQAGKTVSPEDRDEALGLFVSLAETYDGEYGYSYSNCALECDPSNDRAAQLAMYYAAQVQKTGEVAYPMAAYLAANPEGAVAADARALVMEAISAGGDDSLIAALTPAKDAAPAIRVAGLAEIAKALLSTARKSDAAERYQEIILLEPAHEEAVQFLSSELRDSKKHLELKNLLLAAGQDESAYTESRHDWLSEVALLCEGPLKDVEGAIEANRLLVMMDPSDEAAADHLEGDLERAERWEELAALVQRRAENDPDPSSQIARARRAAEIHRDKRQDIGAAAVALSVAVRIEPDAEELALEAAGAFEEAGKPELAVQLLSDLLREMLGGDARVTYSRRLGGLLEAAGAFPEAGGAYAEAASGASDSTLWAQAAKCFGRAEDYEPAARSVAEQRALVDDPLEQASLCAEQAAFLTKLGDTEGALTLLAESNSLDASNEAVFGALEKAYTEAERFGELVSLLLSRADAEDAVERRVALRKRAALLQRDQMHDEEGMRQALLSVLEDANDEDALTILAANAEELGQATAAIGYLERLVDAVTEDKKEAVSLRLAALLEEEGDEAGALSHYLSVLERSPELVVALAAAAHLQEATEDVSGAVESYQRLIPLASGDQKLAAARRVGDLLLTLGDQEAAFAAFEVVLGLDPEDLEAVEQLRDLAETGERWEAFAKYQKQLVDVEGDEAEAANMALQLAGVLAEELKKPAQAMDVLVPFARENQVACRDEYIRLGDELGKKGEVAEALLSWMSDAPAGPKRNHGLMAAYERFAAVGNASRAIEVGLELVRMKGASEALATSLEDIAKGVNHIEALQAAFQVLGRELSGPPRAEEMVRQAELLAASGMSKEDAVLHGEQALTSVDPAEANRLLVRLMDLAASPAAKVGIFERQVGRCKSPEDRLKALCRAAEVAANLNETDKVRQFFEIALASFGKGDALASLRREIRESDEDAGRTVLREALATCLAEAGKGARDGGKSRGLYLSQAAAIASEDLKDLDRAFEWLGEALIAHVEEGYLDQLESMGLAKDALPRVAETLGQALEKVHDGPLVRLLLRRRYDLRAGQLGDAIGATEDLKRLYDLSPSDTEIANKLEAIYVDADDHRGLVRLYEDQILRSRDQESRGELARKVALIWQDTLREPRECADAWRRVLRMNSGDVEAKEGLERAKKDMRKVTAEDISKAEDETRARVEAQTKKEEADILRREAELALKAEQLKARHSQPPQAPETLEREDAPAEPADAPPPPGVDDAPPEEPERTPAPSAAVEPAGEPSSELEPGIQPEAEVEGKASVADPGEKPPESERPSEPSGEDTFVPQDVADKEEVTGEHAVDFQEVLRVEKVIGENTGKTPTLPDAVDEQDDPTRTEAEAGQEAGVGEDAETAADDVSVHDAAQDAVVDDDELMEGEPEAAAAPSATTLPSSPSAPPPPSSHSAPPPLPPSGGGAPPPPPPPSGGGAPPPPPPSVSKAPPLPPGGAKLPPPPLGAKLPPPPSGAGAQMPPPPPGGALRAAPPPPPGARPPGPPSLVPPPPAGVRPPAPPAAVAGRKPPPPPPPPGSKKR